MILAKFCQSTRVPGESFLVELLGDWVSPEVGTGLVRSTHDNVTAFRGTLEVKVVKRKSPAPWSRY